MESHLLIFSDLATMDLGNSNYDDIDVRDLTTVSSIGEPIKSENFDDVTDNYGLLSFSSPFDNPSTYPVMYSQ